MDVQQQDRSLSPKRGDEGVQMNYRGFVVATGLLAALVAVALAGSAIMAQTPEEADAFTTPRTPWGVPDLQGIWSPGYILTPLERPDEFADKEFLTDEDVAALEERATVRRRDQRSERGSVADVEGAYNEAFTGRGKEVVQTRRTSLIVDPPDGKIPFTEQGQAVVDAARSKMMSELADGPEDRRDLDRCRGVSLPFISGTSGTYSRVVQSPGSITLYHEDGHIGGGFRTVYMDGRPHLPPHIRQWLGHSVGRWEGDTLVIETTNFTDHTSFNGSGEQLHLIERFTRVAGDLIMYEVTAADPEAWTRDWTIELPLERIDNEDNQIYEAACHEGNYAMTSILAGARVLERRSSQR